MERSMAGEVYMRRALELAANGRGAVSPNPMVGCVIVHDDKIIGEGWHRAYGAPHAEVNAIDYVQDKKLLKDSTLYVTLEPCSHFGKTPPCADLLIREKIKKVVIANVDPNPLVAGSGIKKLCEAGVEVVTGVLEEDARDVNRRFFTCMEQKRPYIILKWAETSDGFIARENYDSKWISNEISRQFVHKWRSEEHAVLVGYNTALHDNPKLNVRDWTGRHPVRVVLDRLLMLPRDLHLFDQSQPTLVYNTSHDERKHNLEFVKLQHESFIASVIQDLYIRKLQSVIIEGGAQILNAFIKAGLWDEARIFTSPVTFLKGVAAPAISGRMISNQKIREDNLSVYYRE